MVAISDLDLVCDRLPAKRNVKRWSYIVEKGDWQAVSNIARGRYRARAALQMLVHRDPDFAAWLSVVLNTGRIG